jgi:toxin CcdB
MAQYDVYTNSNAAQRQLFPYVVQIQCNALNGLPARVVIPLQRPRIAFDSLPRRLGQTIIVDGEALYVAVHFIAAVPPNILKSPVANVGEQRAILTDAIDALQSGV